MATYTIKLVVAGQDNASGPLRKSKDAVDGLGESSDKSAPKIRGFAEIATGALRRVGEVAVNAGGAAVGAIAGFVADSIGQAGDFEAGMNRFASVVGSAMEESGQSTESFRQLFLDLGQSTAFSAAQAQDAAINLAKGGLDPATIAAGGLKAALDLAAAGELDLAQAAEISAKQYGVWVDASADAADKAAFLAENANLLAQAANASTVDVDDLALGLANTGLSAKTAGLSFRETVTTMALLAPGFSSAADAGTSMKVMLSRLIPTTDSQAQAMKQLGLLTADGSSAFYDATGSFIGMEGAAQLLHDATKDLSQEQKSLALNAIFGQDAFRAAALLAEQGAEGYNRVAGSMAAAGSAAEQAAMRNQGFNFALDSASGALETLGIVAGSYALPALTMFLNDALIPAISGVTQFIGALGDPSTTIGAWAMVISENLVPGLLGLAAATLAYGVTTLPTVIPQVMAAVTAFTAQAAAIAATLLPLAAIGIAVAGVGIAYNDFNTKVTSATQKLLESREWWNASTAALDAYNASQLETNANVAAAAATVEHLRTKIEEETASLGRRMAAGMVTDAQYQQEMASINSMAASLQVATGHLNSQIDAATREAAASMTASSAVADMGAAHDGMAVQIALTAEEVQKLGEQIETIYTETGPQALAKYVSTEASFLDGVEERQAQHATEIEKLEAQKREATTAEQRAAIDEQIAAANAAYAESEQSQATSYAAQQAAQRSHLGQMLIDYTVGQAALGNISKEKAAEITGALEEEYGLQESSTASTFLNMASSIDSFASDSGASIDSLIGTLRDQETAAVETERAMTDMSKEYVAEAVANFVEKGGEADDYAATLRAIPSRVVTDVVTRYSEEGSPSGGSGGGGQPAAGRALGGPANEGQAYTVGERGTELFVPDQDGRILSSQELAGLLGGSGGGGDTYNFYNTINNADIRDEERLSDLLRTQQLLAEGL